MTASQAVAEREARSLRPIVDTHIHLWNLAHPTLRWSWLESDDDHPILGEIDAVKMRAFEMHHLHAESRFAGVSGFVHVQAAIGSADPVEETRWLTAMADQHPALQALVVHADLGRPDIEQVLEAHAASPLLRGVRDFAVEPYLASGEQHVGMEQSLVSLARRGLVLDLDCEYPNMPAALAMARRHPDLTVVLEHIGFPRRRDATYAESWRAGVAQLAQAPNVLCKISGVGMTDPLFTYDRLRPWVQHCLDSFGPGRCMLGSNWPLDRLCSSYDVIMDFYRSCLGPLEPADQDLVLSGTALRTYRLRQLAGSSAA